jgi:tetratricopeptide (TPR) repeat protein
MLNRNEEAVEQFNKVLELNPDFYTAYTDLRMALQMLGEKEKLAEIVERALHFFPAYLMRHPDDARAYLFFASFLQYAGSIDEAKLKMSRAVELSPNDAMVIYNASCVYSTMGENALAVENLQRALANGYDNREYIKLDPDLDNIREEPGYLELMKEA